NALQRVARQNLPFDRAPERSMEGLQLLSRGGCLRSRISSFLAIGSRFLCGDSVNRHQLEVRDQVADEDLSHAIMRVRVRILVPTQVLLRVVAKTGIVRLITRESQDS